MKRILTILFVAAILSVIASAYIQTFRQFREGDHRTAALHTITPAAIREIEVYGDYFGSSHINVPGVNSDTSKVLFAQAMHDLSNYIPNHDRNTQKFFIRMLPVNGGKHEFIIWLKPGVKGTAFLDMVEQSTADNRIHIKNLGSRKSEALYQWLEHHGLIKGVHMEPETTR